MLLNNLAYRVNAQKYVTKSGKISFFSATPIENIEAISNKCGTALDLKSGALVTIIPIRSFKFDRSLMQEHFNENYLESHKYPNATFIGKIPELQNLDLSKNGTHNVTAVGELNIHNVSRSVIIPGILTIKNKVISLESSFDIKCVDYNISIPKIVVTKIAEVIKVSLSNNLDLSK